MAMTSSRPYLVRALYEWIVDNQCTPYILVNAMADEVLVPQNFVNPDGQVVLNISPGAVVDLFMEDHSISFRARFGGVPTDIFVPYKAILGIYAKENQQGMIFEPESDDLPPDNTPKKTNKGDSASKLANKKSGNNRPSLKVIK